MVWAGTNNVTGFDKQGKFTYNQTTFDADGEVGTVIDLHDYLPNVVNATSAGALYKTFTPSYANFYVTATHATTVTDVVAIALEGSVDNLAWDVLCNVTDADAYTTDTTTGNSDVISATAFANVGYRYFRINCTTVGAGNTLRGYAEIW